MGWHRDNEPELGRYPVIVSLSLGEPRRFRLRQKANGISPLTFDLGYGDLLVMYGLTQAHWEHALPKTRKELGPRMNIISIGGPVNEPADLMCIASGALDNWQLVSPSGNSVIMYRSFVLSLGSGFPDDLINLMDWWCLADP